MTAAEAEYGVDEAPRAGEASTRSVTGASSARIFDEDDGAH